MTPTKQARAEVEAWLGAHGWTGKLESWPMMYDLIAHLTPVFERARDGIGTVMQDVAKENLERAERAEAECDSIMAQLREAMIDLEEGSTDRQAAEDMQNLASKYMDERDALTAQLADARRERDEAITHGAEQEVRAVDAESRLALVEAGAAQFKAQCLQIVATQPFYPDTHTGMRQLWVKDQIAEKIRALSSSAGTEFLAAVKELVTFVPEAIKKLRDGSWSGDADPVRRVEKALAAPCLQNLGKEG